MPEQDTAPAAPGCPAVSSRTLFRTVEYPNLPILLQRTGSPAFAELWKSRSNPARFTPAIPAHTGLSSRPRKTHYFSRHPATLNRPPKHAGQTTQGTRSTTPPEPGPPPNPTPPRTGPSQPTHEPPADQHPPPNNRPVTPCTPGPPRRSDRGRRASRRTPRKPTAVHRHGHRGPYLAVGESPAVAEMLTALLARGSPKGNGHGHDTNNPSAHRRSGPPS